MRRPETVQFCQRCGGGLEAREAFGRERPVCPCCGFVHFENTGTAAVSVVLHARRLLLVRRAVQPYRGLWGFPGGFQEYGESLEETAVRETREETGLAVRIERLLAVTHTTDDPRKLVNVAVYLARPDPDEERAVAAALGASDDASDARFFGLDEIPRDVAFDSSKAVLRRLRSEFPDGDLR